MTELLVERAAAGDAEALREVLEAHYDRLHKFVSRQLPPAIRNWVDPADVVQETMSEACRLVTGFVPDGDDSFFRWLATIARNQMRTLLRRWGVRHQRGESALANQDGEADEVAVLLEQLGIYLRTPSKSAAAHELMAALQQSIERLPKHQRSAVTLRHIEGLSVPEAAAAMDCRPEDVYVSCCRALQSIRNDLKSASLYR